MNATIKKHQDTMVKYVIKAKELQHESGLQVGLAMEGTTSLIPVDAILKSLLQMTTRQDLKDRIYKAQIPPTK